MKENKINKKDFLNLLLHNADVIKAVTYFDDASSDNTNRIELSSIIRTNTDILYAYKINGIFDKIEVAKYIYESDKAFRLPEEDNIKY